MGKNLGYDWSVGTDLSSCCTVRSGNAWTLVGIFGLIR
jgi:hypothetical protein